MDNKHYRTELFDNRESAEKAWDDAIKEGYKPEDIDVLMSDESRKKYYGSELVREKGDKSMEGLAVGGALGGAITGTLAAIAAIGTTLAIPGLGIVIGGPLAAGLAGAGAGSISGGLIGALVGWGIPEDRAKIYENGIKSGGIVLGVREKPNTRLDENWSRYRSRSLTEHHHNRNI